MFDNPNDDYMFPQEESVAFRKGQVDDANAGFRPVPGVTLLTVVVIVLVIVGLVSFVSTHT